MKLPPELRERFRRHGAAGGRARAARMTPAAKSAVARLAATGRWTRSRFGAPSFESAGFPGGSTVDTGLADLARGRATVEGLLVSLAAARLRREGVPVTRALADPEDRLFALLTRTEGDLAHARYTALLRQMSSFADACRNERHRRAGHAT